MFDSIALLMESFAHTLSVCHYTV